MSPPTGGSEMTPGAPGTKAANGWTGTAILGFLAFGLTAILYGLSQLPKPYSAGFTASVLGNTVTDVTLGGLVLLLVGLIGLLQGHAYWGSAFLGSAGFWVIWSTTGQTIQSTLTDPAGYAVAGIAFIWLLFTLTYLISSMKHGWGTFFGFLFLFVAIILSLIEAWQVGGATKLATGTEWAAGGLWIVTGIVWWFKGTNDLTSHTYGRKILPL